MDNQDQDRERLNKVSSRIADIRANEAAKAQEKQSAATDKAYLSDGARAGAELISLLIAGFVIGWGADRLLETTPFFLIIFVLGGIGLGFYKVYRITQKDTGKEATPQLQKIEKDATKPPKE